MIMSEAILECLQVEITVCVIQSIRLNDNIVYVCVHICVYYYITSDAHEYDADHMRTCVYSQITEYTKLYHIYHMVKRI